MLFFANFISVKSFVIINVSDIVEIKCAIISMCGCMSKDKISLKKINKIIN